MAWPQHWLPYQFSMTYGYYGAEHSRRGQLKIILGEQVIGILFTRKELGKCVLHSLLESYALKYQVKHPLLEISYVGYMWLDF